MVEQSKKSHSRFRVAIVMPVRNEEAYLGTTLAQVCEQEFPLETVEVVLGDGGSTDRTREIALSFAPRFGSLTIHDNPVRLPSAGRNVGVRGTTAPYVLILDGHCFLPSRRLLADMIDLFERNRADCLCRPQPLDPPDITQFQQAVAYCRDSALGHKPGSEIYADFEGVVDPTSSGAMYRRQVFDEVGYFDERFDACEDVDFNHRVHAAGLTSFLSPKLTVRYYPRTSIRGLWKQMGRYGRGRFRFSSKHGIYSPIQWLAAAGVVGFAALILVTLLLETVRPWMLGAILLYALLVTGVSAVIAVRRKHLPTLFYGPAIFPTIHFGLGTGFLRGLGEWLFASRR